jgi:hypothetical protein
MTLHPIPLPVAWLLVKARRRSMVVGAKFGAANGGTGLRQNEMIKE